MKLKIKAKNNLLVIFLCTMLVACSSHEPADRKSQLENKCNISANVNLCSDWNLEEEDCENPRLNYLEYQYKVYFNGSAETYKKEIELLTMLHSCLKQNYLKIPVFQTAQKLLVQKEIIHTQESCNVVKAKLSKVSKTRVEVGVGMIRKKTNRCFT